MEKIDKELNDEIQSRRDSGLDCVDIKSDGLAGFGLEGVYGNAIRKLKEIESILNQCDFYFKLSKNISCIQSSLSCENVEMDSLVSEICDCIRLIDSADSLSYKEINSLLEQFYDILYLVIKKEIFLTGDSQVFHYIEVYSNFVPFIDDEVKKDIQKNDLEKFDNIRMRCDVIESAGLSSTYFDLGLIKLIVDEENKEQIMEKERDDYQRIYDNFYIKVENERKELDGLEDDYNRSRKKRDEYKQKISKLRKKLVKKGLILGLCGSAVVALGSVAIPKLFKENKYKTVTTFYEENGESYSKEEYLEELVNKSSIVIYEYELSENSLESNDYQWNCDAYLYGTTFDDDLDIQKLFDVDLSNYEKLLQPNVEYSDEVDLKSYGDGGYRKVVITRQDMDDSISYFLFDDFSAFLSLLSLLSAGPCGILLGFLYTKSMDISDSFRLLKKDYLIQAKEMKDIYSKLVDFIQNNETLREEFNSCYQEYIWNYGENKELDDLYNKVNEVDRRSNALVKKKKWK